MKQILLLLCTIPCLLTAQNSIHKEENAKLFNGLSTKIQKVEDRLSLRSGSHDNLPDTIYTYGGAKKRLLHVDAITYDEKGRKVLVMRKIDNNGNGIIDESDDKNKSEFTYTQVGDSITEECVNYENKKDKWHFSSKEIFAQNKIDMSMSYSKYTYYDNDWFSISEMVATEFNEKGLPIVVNCAYFYPPVSDTTDFIRMEILYNKNDLDSVYSFFLLAERGILKDTIPVEEAVYTYNENDRLSKYVHSYYDKDKKVWDYGFTIDYTYDDKGNLASKIEANEYGIEVERYYKNIYPITVSNDPVFSVQSTVYPNPVSNVLNVTIDNVDQAVITLISENGSIVAQQKVQQSTAAIPVGSLAKGYYFLRVQTAQGTKTHKVIVK